MSGFSLVYFNFLSEYSANVVTNDEFNNTWFNLKEEHINAEDDLNDSVIGTYKRIINKNETNVASDFEQQSFKDSLEAGRSSLTIFNNLKALTSSITGLFSVPLWIKTTILLIVLSLLTFAAVQFIRSGGNV